MVYAPGTLETDPKKQNMALQQQASSIKTNTTNIATNTANIATNTTNIAANAAAIALLQTAGIGLAYSGGSLKLSITTYLGNLSSDVTLTTAGTYYDGPTVSQGTTGKFFFLAQASCKNSTGSSPFAARVTDGTTVFGNSSIVYNTSAGARVPAIAFGIATNPVADLKLQAADLANNGTKMVFNDSGAGHDSYLLVARIG